MDIGVNGLPAFIKGFNLTCFTTLNNLVVVLVYGVVIGGWLKAGGKLPKATIGCCESAEDDETVF
jgi:hypothetical protein